MALLVQIILINLVVSCDNVGVIALATRDLEDKQARTARRLGIGLSLVLKLVFIGVTGFLFSIPWLHIRIIGGVMLIYVTWNMLRQGNKNSAKPSSVSGKRDGFLFAIVSIIAADVSMSLDNVIAILSIVSTDGQPPDLKDMLLVVGGLVVCVPVLLWFSGTVSRIMERYPFFTYLCAGYLVYTAFRMIFEDETIALFFQSINFTFTTQAAILFGFVVVSSGMYAGGARGAASAKRRRAMIMIYGMVVLYSLILVGTASFLSTNPVFDGERHSVEQVYGFSPCGAAAVLLIGDSPVLFTLCASIMVGIVMDEMDGCSGKGCYLEKLRMSMLGMAVLILLELAICTVGLSAAFGFGSMKPATWIAVLFFQLLLHCAYISMFCMIRVLVRGKAATVVLSMLLVFLENIVVDVCVIWGHWRFLAGFLPDYYIITLPDQLISLPMLLRMALIPVLCIAVSTYVGTAYCQGRHRLPGRFMPA